MKILFLLLIIVGIFTIECSSQVKDFHFRRKLEVNDSGWYSLVLPGDAFRNLRNDFSDIRIYQFIEKDTTEAPYVLSIREKEVTEETFNAKIFNQSRRDGRQFISLELPKNAEVNFLDLSFSESNFDGYASLQGSNDQKEWYEITKNQRIISIDNQDIHFYSGKIHFSTQNFRFLRIALKMNKTLTLTSATIKKETVVPGILSEVESSWEADVNKKSKRTTIEVKLRDAKPIVSMNVSIDERTDFYRSFRLERISDSTSTPKGWQYIYETITQGYFTSLDSNTFTFSYVPAKKMRIVIDDGDNPSLHVKDISFFSPKIELTARMKKGTHYLYYGNWRLGTPEYDLVHFKDKIPQQAPAINPGEEEKLIIEQPPVSPLIKNKMWLWILMGVVIAVLGFFTVRMMKEK
ncbi:hypothetical protein WSM22_02170 [Cytophagales bacterium WSM2-2]|nr:hypothetical protein WSM22_02170 [Cytophagales bacterium WSM2-2]